MIDKNHVKCTGCTACSSICPVAAITMKYDEEGFLYPYIDIDSCIECNKCSDVCPIDNFKLNKINTECYACWNKNLLVREKSSSGALFPLLAESIIDKGGIVCGATLDSNLFVKHIIIDDKRNIHLLQGSKYVQSSLEGCFAQIKEALEKDKWVLFSGTPCQVSGINNYLQQEYKKLLTVDIVCHGVPSPGVFNVYLDELRSKIGEFSQISFRDKNEGWTSLYNFSAIKNNGEIKLRERIGKNIFLTAFLQDFILRKCCYSCDYASLARPSDLSLGDFWNIQKYLPQFNDAMGTSLLLINSMKGKSFIDEIQNSLARIEKIDAEIAVKNNANLRRPSLYNARREAFFAYFAREKKFTSWFEKEFNKVGIINFHHAENFGAVLLSYAMTKVISDLGYHCEVINYRPSGISKKSFCEEFREKYLPQSKLITNKNELNNLDYKTIITGSDQVWKLGNTALFMLDWAKGEKRLISYAASFGDDTYSGNISKKLAKILLKRFDAISVREASGVNICHNTFEVHAKHVLDPTLLLTSDNYLEFIKGYMPKITIPERPYILTWCYSDVNNKHLNHNNVLSAFKNSFDIVDCWKLTDRTIECILYLLNNASYIITDSFHATLFSIILRKEFVSLVPQGFNGTSRIPSILEALGIKNRIVDNVSLVDDTFFKDKIDYNLVEEILGIMKTESIDYLKKSLKLPIFIKSNEVDEYYNSCYWKRIITSYRSHFPPFLELSVDYDKPYYQLFFPGITHNMHFEFFMVSSTEMLLSLHCEGSDLMQKKGMRDIFLESSKMLPDFKYQQNENLLSLGRTVSHNEIGIQFKMLSKSTVRKIYNLFETLEPSLDDWI